nr:hypothetical protein CFP56_04777 [Quercus suber]
MIILHIPPSNQTTKTIPTEEPIGGTTHNLQKPKLPKKAPQLDRAPVVFPRFTKLHLAEAQEMHKQKYEEVQALDKSTSRPISSSFYRIVIFSEEMLESTKPRMTSNLATLASTAEELKGSSDERPALFSATPLSQQ